jgi:hypothetical protein
MERLRKSERNGVINIYSKIYYIWIAIQFIGKATKWVRWIDHFNVKRVMRTRW